MKLAPLQLVDYFVHSIQVEAQPGYDPEKPADLDIDALKVSEKCFPLDEKHPGQYAIDLVIRQEQTEGKNMPYTFELHIVGYVDAIPDIPEDKARRMIEINGPSMLFGAAREIIRAATGRGPYGPILIPSATFYTPPSTDKPTAKKAAKKSAKKHPKTLKKETRP